MIRQHTIKKWNKDFNVAWFLNALLSKKKIIDAMTGIIGSIKKAPITILLIPNVV